MRIFMASLSMLALAACGTGRQVEVRTGPEPAAEVAIHLTNNLSHANSVEHIPVAGVPAGATVNLRAVTVDGTRTYTKNSVTLSSTMYDWRLP